jgi:deoxycytidylate deaminase
LNYLNFGKRIAQRSPNNFKHSTIILRGGKVVSYGYNHDDIHAEQNALSKLWPNKRKGTTVLNFRIGRRGNLLNSKPCEFCLELIRKSKVAKIIYSTENGFEEL